MNGLSDFYYNSDEAWHLVIASQKTVADVIDYNFRNEIHPPLSPLIWHFMLKISDNILWIRSASYIPSILIIPSVYYLGRLYIGRAAGFAMAMIAAFGVFSISFGNAVRAYPLMVLALVWAGIFVYKYINTQQKKYVVYYFILAFIAIELVHSAAFMLFVYATMLMWGAYKNKAKSAFAAITIGHIFLAVCLVWYIYTVKSYRSLEFGYLYFILAGNIPVYLWAVFCRVVIFILNMVAADNNAVAFAICMFCLFAAPFVFIKNKRLDLLYIVFTPLIFVIITDYLKIYPFPQLPRNNLFLFIPFLLLFGFFFQKLYEYICNSLETINNSKGIKLGYLLKERLVDVPQALYLAIFGKVHYILFEKDKHKFLAKVIITISIPIIWAISDFSSGSFRNPKVSSVEYYMPASHFQQFIDYINKYQKDSDVMIVEHQMIWYFTYLEGENSKTNYITENLGHFKSPNYEFYFPYEEAFLSFHHFKGFASDLYKTLQGNGRLPSVNNIIYVGGSDSLIGEALTPHFISKVEMYGSAIDWYDEALYNFNLEQEIFSWEVLSSNLVTTKISKKDSSSDLYISVLGMRPQFIKDAILEKDFIDIIGMKKKALLGK